MSIARRSRNSREIPSAFCRISNSPSCRRPMRASPSRLRLFARHDNRRRCIRLGSPHRSSLVGLSRSDRRRRTGAASSNSPATTRNSPHSGSIKCRRRWGRHWVGAMAGGPLLFFCCKIPPPPPRNPRGATVSRKHLLLISCRNSKPPPEQGKKQPVAPRNANRCSNRGATGRQNGAAPRSHLLSSRMNSGLCVRTRQLAANRIAAVFEPGFRPRRGRQGKTDFPCMFSFAATARATYRNRFSFRLA